MVLPGVVCLFIPLFVGYFFGVLAIYGLLPGIIVSGVC